MEKTNTLDIKLGRLGYGDKNKNDWVYMNIS